MNLMSSLRIGKNWPTIVTDGRNGGWPLPSSESIEGSNNYNN